MMSKKKRKQELEEQERMRELETYKEPELEILKKKTKVGGK